MAAGLAVTVLNAGLAAMAGTGDLADAVLATGDPGSAGTANPSSVTTAEAVTWPGTATSGVIAASNTPEWTSWAGTNGESVSWIKLQSSGGTFGGSMQLGSPVTMDTADSLSLTEIQVSMAGAVAS